MCLDNVALHKSAWQQNPYGSNGFNASLAIDGRKRDLSQWGGECVASGYGETAEWRVDLNGVLSIHHIVIQYIQGIRGTHFHTYWNCLKHLFFSFYYWVLCSTFENFMCIMCRIYIQVFIDMHVFFNKRRTLSSCVFSYLKKTKLDIYFASQFCRGISLVGWSVRFASRRYG